MQELQADARLSVAELARRIYLSKSACLQRLRGLEDDGYILGYETRLNPSKFGLSQLVIVRVRLQSKDYKTLEAFRTAVERDDTILTCHMTAGGSDFFLSMRTPSMTEFKEYLDSVLLVMPGVDDLEIYTVMEEIKHAAALPLSFDGHD